MNPYILSDFSTNFNSYSYRTCGLKKAYPHHSELRLTEAEVRFLSNQESIQLTVTVWQHKKMWYSKGFQKISHVVIVNGDPIKGETYNDISIVDWHGSPIPYLALLEFCEQNHKPFKNVLCKFRRAFKIFSGGHNMVDPIQQNGLIRNPDFEEHKIQILPDLNKINNDVIHRYNSIIYNFF